MKHALRRSSAPRAALCLLLTLFLLLTLCACKKEEPAAGPTADDKPASAGDAALMEPIGTYGGALETAAQVRLELPAQFSEFAASMEAMRDQGLELLGYDMPLQAEFCLAYAGGSVSSVRFAADELLAARGKAPAGDDAYAGWDLVGNISMNTPVPFYMEALCAESAGDTVRATELYELAALNPVLPDGTEALKALPELSDKELAETRAALAAFEAHIYGLCPVDPLPLERCGYEFFPEFHLSLADAHTQLGEHSEAAQCCRDAVKCDPFDIDVIIAAAMTTLNTGDMDEMLYYIDNGLLLSPDNPNINAVAALYWAAAGDSDAARGYLETARAGEITGELSALCDRIEASLEGGQ